MPLPTAIYPGFGKALVNPLAAAMGPPVPGVAPDSGFQGAESDMINYLADDAKAAGSPINDWARVNENRQALADLYKSYHGGRTRGEVTQGVGVQVPGAAPQVGVRTLYRADPGTRQFAFSGGDPAAQIAAAQGAGGTIGNSPQLADMISQQSVAQKAATDAAMAKAEQTKADASTKLAGTEQAKVDLEAMQFNSPFGRYIAGLKGNLSPGDAMNAAYSFPQDTPPTSAPKLGVQGGYANTTPGVQGSPQAPAGGGMTQTPIQRLMMNPGSAALRGFFQQDPATGGYPAVSDMESVFHNLHAQGMAPVPGTPVGNDFLAALRQANPEGVRRVLEGLPQTRSPGNYYLFGDPEQGSINPLARMFGQKTDTRRLLFHGLRDLSDPAGINARRLGVQRKRQQLQQAFEAAKQFPLMAWGQE